MSSDVPSCVPQLLACTSMPVCVLGYATILSVRVVHNGCETLDLSALARVDVSTVAVVVVVAAAAPAAPATSVARVRCVP